MRLQQVSNFFKMVFFFILNIVLGPKLKLNYYKKYEWEEQFINQARNILIDVYKNDYSDIIVINNNDDINKDDFFYELFGNNSNNYNGSDFELEDYLNKPVVGAKVDPLRWWKVNCNLIVLI